MVIKGERISNRALSMFIALVVFILTLIGATITLAIKTQVAIDKYDDLQTLFNEATQSNVDLTNAVNQISSENEQLKSEIESLNETKTSLESQVDDLNKQLKTAKSEISSLSRSSLSSREGSRTSYNPFSISGLSIEQMDKMLANTGLAGCGQYYKDMENTYNVNALFAMAVACHESANGYKLANTNNYYGMKNGSGWMSFDSKKSNIMYFGQLMNKSMYKNKSIENIGKVYCPGTYSHWSKTVQVHMANLLSRL